VEKKKKKGKTRTKRRTKKKIKRRRNGEKSQHAIPVPPLQLTGRR